MPKRKSILNQKGGRVELTVRTLDNVTLKLPKIFYKSPDVIAVLKGNSDSSLRNNVMPIPLQSGEITLVDSISKSKNYTELSVNEALSLLRVTGAFDLYDLQEESAREVAKRIIRGEIKLKNILASGEITLKNWFVVVDSLIEEDFEFAKNACYSISIRRGGGEFYQILRDTVLKMEELIRQESEQEGPEKGREIAIEMHKQKRQIQKRAKKDW